MNKGKSITDYRIEAAVNWLVDLSPDEKPSPIIPTLRERFALSAVDACHAVAEANLRRAKAMAEKAGSY